MSQVRCILVSQRSWPSIAKTKQRKEIEATHIFGMHARRSNISNAASREKRNAKYVGIKGKKNKIALHAQRTCVFRMWSDDGRCAVFYYVRVCVCVCVPGSHWFICDLIECDEMNQTTICFDKSHRQCEDVPFYLDQKEKIGLTFRAQK